MLLKFDPDFPGPTGGIFFDVFTDNFQSEMQGLTGLIKFDTAGFRSDFQLDVLRLTEDGLKKIGMWNSTNSIEWQPESDPPKSEMEFNLQNKTFIILIAIVRALT